MRGNLLAEGLVGIYLSGSVSGSVIQGNSIGTDNSGTLELGHSENGITIDAGAFDNLIGGTVTGTGNIIGYNGHGLVYPAGIALTDLAGSGNSIIGNQFVRNTGLSIDLENIADSASGVTDNDVNDLDSGPNDYLNFPVLWTGELDGSNLSLTGALAAEPSSQYRIEFYSAALGTEDGSGHGEAHILLGSISVTTDGSGNASINHVLTGVRVADGDRISAIATEIVNAGMIGIDDNLAFGSTSEVSLNIAVDTKLVAKDDSADYIALVQSHSPVSHWSLGEASGSVSIDSGSAANNASLSGGTLQQTGAITASLDTAISLNGTSDRIEVADSPAYNLRMEL